MAKSKRYDPEEVQARQAKLGHETDPDDRVDESDPAYKRAEDAAEGFDVLAVPEGVPSFVDPPTSRPPLTPPAEGLPENEGA